ncbi:hypothetical protein [Paenibacillus glacialis]|uniref:hypothetical protein n=1 Tax=Paenibacillus glacialis TaxID=494026 RepID=UPI001372A294|nr:hypothetical protein [Paenibacillus glacialis]
MAKHVLIDQLKESQNIELVMKREVFYWNNFNYQHGQNPRSMNDLMSKQGWLESYLRLNYCV